MAEKSPEAASDGINRPANHQREKSLGEPNRQRTEQTSTLKRPMENQINHIHRYRGSDGRAMERTRIVFAHELPDCKCCNEPWCPVHMEHYADCGCVGPCNAEDDGWELEERDGILYGIRPLPAGGCVDSDEGTCPEIATNQTTP